MAQAPGGGLRDKPGKPADAYHTSSNLSGLSSAQSKMVLSQSMVSTLRDSFISPLVAPEVVEINEGENEESPMEMVTDDYETDEAAVERMREVWSRTLGWIVEGKPLFVGGEENELVSSLSLASLLCEPSPVLALVIDRYTNLYRHRLIQF